MRILLLTLTVMAGYIASAQIAFEPAYFITNSGDSIYCLIKNTAPENTPPTIRIQTNRAFGS